jgi:hypothetical protein
MTPHRTITLVPLRDHGPGGGGLLLLLQDARSVELRWWTRGLGCPARRSPGPAAGARSGCPVWIRPDRLIGRRPMHRARRSHRLSAAGVLRGWRRSSRSAALQEPAGEPGHRYQWREARLHVFGALAEFERDLIREHTMAGLAAARARGQSAPARLRSRTRAKRPAGISRPAGRTISVLPPAARQFRRPRAAPREASGYLVLVAPGRRGRPLSWVQQRAVVTP